MLEGKGAGIRSQRHHGRARLLGALILVWVTVFPTSCVFVFRGVEVAPIDLQSDSLTIRTRVKAHLADGSTVLYPNGVTFARDSVRGDGVRFALTGDASAPALPVTIDSVAAMESYRTAVNRRKSLWVSLVVTVVNVGVIIVDWSRSGFSVM